jgi:hypothetical protein
MCNIIVINRGELEISTPKEFLDYFGFEAPVEPHYSGVVMDACLCQVDVEGALKQHGIQYSVDCGDIYCDSIKGGSND